MLSPVCSEPFSVRACSLRATSAPPVHLLLPLTGLTRAHRRTGPQRAGDRESSAFISGPAAFVGGVPLTRAMNPWAMPEASTKRPVMFPCELIPLSDVKADPG